MLFLLHVFTQFLLRPNALFMFVVQIVFPFKTAILFVAPKLFAMTRKSDKEMVNFTFLFVPKND